MNTIAEAGRKGSDVRSDCYICIELRKSGGIKIELVSRVDVLYGKSIKNIIKKGCEYFGIENAIIKVEDSGALQFVIMARLETAVKRLGKTTRKEFLPEMLECAKYPTKRDRFRRSRLYLPGNEPKYMLNAGIHKPDGIILDLEDSVNPTEKDAARILVRNALRQVDFYGCERMVRINQIPAGLEDLDYVIPHNVHVILIPKCEKAEDVLLVNERIIKILKGKKKTVYLMPIIESALGVINAYEIASSAENVVALTIGLEDYTADIGTQRTIEGKESFFARSMIVNAAKAAGIQAIDTVFSDVTDMEGLRNSVIEAKSLGFEGKGCIHPRQISVIHEAFAPDDAEIQKAIKIVKAYKEAETKGLSVVAVGNKMIDPPVVKRAMKTIEHALSIGRLQENWMEN
ncbi:MAG: Citrate lyase beta chain [Ignavibacteriae bacterium]|nr:MAG: Citrate lyase beta chain [Ignavibacteriota bacterium]